MNKNKETKGRSERWYQEKYFFNAEWQKRSHQIMARDKYTCRMCGMTLGDESKDGEECVLQVHHLRYHYQGRVQNAEDEWMVTLCIPCHEFVTIDPITALFPPEKAFGSRPGRFAWTQARMDIIRHFQNIADNREGAGRYWRKVLGLPTFESVIKGVVTLSLPGEGGEFRRKILEQEAIVNTYLKNYFGDNAKINLILDERSYDEFQVRYIDEEYLPASSNEDPF